MSKFCIPAIIVIWLTGVLTSHTFSGAIHLLPLVAFALFVLKLTGEHPTRPGDRAPRMKGSKDFRVKL